MTFTGPMQLAAQDVYKTSTTKLHRLGSQGATRDGRLFRYGLAGAVTLLPGKLNQVPAVVANHQNILVQTAAAVGDNFLNVTLGATAMNNAQYDDGYVIGYDVSGVGQSLAIQGSSATLSSGVANLALFDPVAIAMLTTARVNLEQNSWSGALVYAASATPTEYANGVLNVSLPAASYGWFQTRGEAAVLTDTGGVVKGVGVIPAAAVAGTVATEAAGTIYQRVGLAKQTATATKYSTTYLMVD